MIKKLISRKKFTWFLIILVIVYMTVWIYAFHQQYVAAFCYTQEETDGDRPVNDKCHYNYSPVVVPRSGIMIASDVNRCVIMAKTNNTKDDHSLPRYQRYTTRPFKPGQPKMVVILAYQRVGSSFFGKLFDLNPNIFYVYEPLDSLYRAMYGTESGFNIPSDITSLKDGRNRILPKDEVVAVEEFLTNLFNCRLNKLPTEFFVHSFWSFLPMFMPSWSPYLECLQNVTLIHGRAKCSAHVKCPRRFGAQPSKTDSCKHHLWTSERKMRTKAGATGLNWLTSYKQCMSNVRRAADKCIRIMDSKCKRMLIRVTKTVRATMESIEGLVATAENVRVIQLFRDPRAVAASRMTAKTYRGLYAGNSSVLEAGVYCRILLRDLHTRRRLEKLYPGTFYEVIYEDFVRHPAQYASHVYRFLESDIPDTLSAWILKNTRNTSRPGGENRTRRMSKWKRKLTVEQSEKISTLCKEFYDTIKYDFE